MKTYSIRVSDSVLTGVTSEAMQACLRRFFIDGATAGIRVDPGAGPMVIRRTLPENLVSKFSAALGVPPGEALRRLAATCVRTLPAGDPPALPPPSASSNPVGSTPWWASLTEPVGFGQGESLTKGAGASQKAAISPWGSFWRTVWPELLLLGAVLLVAALTGGLSVNAGAAAAEPYSDWRPE